MFEKVQEEMSTCNDTLKIIERHFHELIIERAKQGNCTEFLSKEDKELPEISTETFTEESAWFPVPGMYGGFAYRLIVRECKPLLVTESWCRVVDGSGQRHEISVEGCVLVDEGFC